MKKIKWKTHKIYILLVVIFVLFFIRSLLLPTQFSHTAIVSVIGIDKVDETYLVSMQIITPKFETGVTKNIEVVTSNDVSLHKCFQNISTALGKKIGLAHLNAIVVNRGLLQKENLSSLLNTITNYHTKNLNSAIITTNHLAYKVLSCSEQEGNIYDIAQSFVTKKKNALLKEVENISHSQKTLLLPFVTLEQINANFDVQTQGAPLETSALNSNKKLKFNGEILLFKNKDEQVILSSEDYENLSLFEKEKNITLETESELEEDINILSCKTKMSPCFYNGKPRLNLNVYLEVQKPKNILQNEAELKMQVILKLRQKLTDAFLLMKQNNMDLFFIKERFSAFHYNNWNEYLSTIKNDNMFEKLEIFAHFTVKLKT